MSKEPRTELHHQDEWKDVLVKMSEGNPGGLQAMIQMIKTDQARGCGCVLLLDDMNIRGTQIWICFSNVCGQDALLLMDFIEDARPDGGRQQLVQCCNNHGKMGNHAHKACMGGASVRGRECFR